MTEVLFYHLERQTLEQVLPRLVQASLGRDWRVVVKAGSPERIQALNTHLWTWADDVFLPHAAAGDARFTEFAADQPVWLTHEDDVPNDAQVLMLVDGAAHDDLSRFERCVFIFDGNDETALATARADQSSRSGSIVVARPHTGAEPAIEPATTCGYLIRIHPDSMPP